MKTFTLPREQALRESWIEFLSRWHWELFATLTFRDTIHPESANKRFQSWVNWANRQRFGPRWYRKTNVIRWARFTELQRRGVLHYHVLMRELGGLNRLSLGHRWQSRNGLAKIEIIKTPPRVLRYVTKCCHEADAVELGGLWDADQLNLLPPSPLSVVRSSDPDREG